MPTLPTNVAPLLPVILPPTYKSPSVPKSPELVVFPVILSIVAVVNLPTDALTFEPVIFANNTLSVVPTPIEVLNVAPFQQLGLLFHLQQSFAHQLKQP